MTDERLQSMEQNAGNWNTAGCLEFVAEVRRLRAKNAKLREALEGVVAVADRKTKEFDAARAALGKEEK